MAAFLRSIPFMVASKLSGKDPTAHGGGVSPQRLAVVEANRSMGRREGRVRMPTALCGVVRAGLKILAASQRIETRTQSPSKRETGVQKESVFRRSQKAAALLGCV